MIYMAAITINLPSSRLYFTFIESTCHVAKAKYGRCFVVNRFLFGQRFVIWIEVDHNVMEYSYVIVIFRKNLVFQCLRYTLPNRNRQEYTGCCVIALPALNTLMYASEEVFFI